MGLLSLLSAFITNLGVDYILNSADIVNDAVAKALHEKLRDPKDSVSDKVNLASSI